MSLTVADKKEIIKKYAIHEGDTGSTEVQIAVLTTRINLLSDHLKEHIKDYHSRKGLLAMVSRRRKLLNYLKEENKENYANIIKELRLRR